jgi:general secretion pathway protein A
MYTDYWNLNCLPFENAPDPKFFFESREHKEAAVRLSFAIETKKAMALVCGDYGCGKTVLCQTVMARLPVEGFRVAFVTNPRLDALDLTREIAYQFGEETLARSKYDVLHAFNNLLDRHHAEGRHCAAIIDEAHLIADTSILEDLRLLLNHHPNGEFLMTLVLVGQTELKETLDPIPQMTQRISLKCLLSQLGPDEARLYIAHRLKTAGGNISIFEERAVSEIATLSKGNPREINAICDMCLLTTSLAGKKQVTQADVVDAAKERS